MRRQAFTVAALCGLVLMAVAALMPVPGRQAVEAAGVGFSVLPDGRGGTNVESVVYPEAMGFDKKRPLKAFESTLYPLLRAAAGLVLCAMAPGAVGGLSAMLNLPADATRTQLLDAMKDVVVGKAAYVGRFHQ